MRKKNKSQEKTAIERKVTSDGPNCNYPKEFANNMQRQLRPITTLNKSEVEDRCENIRKQSESKPLVTLSYKPTSKPPLPTSKKSPNPKTWDTQIVNVNSNTFIPKQNKRSEVQILKIGSPSQIRKAVLCSVTVDDPIEKSITETMTEDGNYKISKIPTTTFDIRRPSRSRSGSRAKDELERVIATTDTNVEKMSKTYAANVEKYSETPSRKSSSMFRPPPPKFKPPPPPPLNL